MTKGRYDFFVFDLYGTLVDIRTNEEKPYLWKKMSELYSSLGAHYSPAELKESFRRLAREETEEVRRKGEAEMGSDFLAEPDLTKIFIGLFSEKGMFCSRERAEMAAAFFRGLSRQKLKVYDGVKETLGRLREGGKGVYLLSNAQRDFTRPDMELVGLTDCFDGILISSEEGCKKPSPIFFHRLFERYSLSPRRCLMVGNDGVCDIAGAQAVGMDSLYIHTETSPEIPEKLSATYTVLDGDWSKAADILLAKAFFPECLHSVNF